MELVAGAKEVLREYRARTDGIDPAVVTLPASASPDLHRSAGQAVQRSVKQVLHFAPHSWDVNAFEHLVWRQVARRGVRVERIYVLAHAGIAPDILREQVASDIEAGIEVRVLLLSRLRAESLQRLSDGFWLVDESSAVLSMRPDETTNESSSWVVTERKEDVAAAIETWNSFWTIASATAETSELDLEEPLVLSADLIHGISPVLCTKDHIDRESCAWYHSAWQYLRLLDMVSTPTWHSGFYHAQLKEALEGRSEPRVLITGTADYSVLAYVHEAARKTKSRPRIQVLDLCPTPLLACRWYAKRHGFDVEIVEADILSVEPSRVNQADVIVTDAFLTRFGEEQARGVLARWKNWLAPGGRIITTVRMHPRSPSARTQEAAVAAFAETAAQRAQRWRPFLKRTPAEIGHLAGVYARKMRSQNAGDERDVQRALAQAGLATSFHKLVEVPGELQRTVYLDLVATAIQEE